MKLKPSNLAFALRHPRQAALIAMYGRWAVLSDSIAWLAGTSGRRAREVFNGVSSGSPFERHIRDSLDEARGGHGADIGFRDEYCLYTLCRLMRPRIVIETGVAAGVSSAFILKALDENSAGALFSIDLPRYESYTPWPGTDHSANGEPGGSTIPLGKKPGFVIPDELRGRWSLDLGLSSDLLPKLLDRVGEVDLFFHDTEHAYQNMTLEYETVWPKIRESGLLIAHGVGRNPAFPDFGKRVRKRPVYLRGTGLGGLKK